MSDVNNTREIPRTLPGDTVRAAGVLVEPEAFWHPQRCDRELLLTPDIAPRKDSLQLVPAQVVAPGANIDAMHATEQRLPGFTEHQGQASWADVAVRMDAVTRRMDACAAKMDEHLGEK